MLLLIGHMSKNNMKIVERIAKLETELKWWQDKLDRSRKASLINLRAMHVNRIQSKIIELRSKTDERN